MSGLPTTPWDPRWTCSEVDTASPAATGIAATAATQVLWALSGRQFGTEQVRLRPCRRGCAPELWGPWWGLEPWSWHGYGYPYPSLWGGQWVNLGCGGCGRDCTCQALQEAVLPAGVTAVTEVRVDGVVLTGTAYRLDRDPTAGGDVLVRLDGGSWPLCNDLTLADTEPGTWSVTATYGTDVPELGRLAVGELGCEFLKAMAGEDCRLPAHVVSLARQGVVLNFPDPTELLSEGKLGLVVADRFLLTVNPDGLRRRARVFSPDHLGPRQVGA
jgi:hypothetical protein